MSRTVFEIFSISGSSASRWKILTKFQKLDCWSGFASFLTQPLHRDVAKRQFISRVRPPSQNWPHLRILIDEGALTGSCPETKLTTDERKINIKLGSFEVILAHEEPTYDMSKNQKYFESNLLVFKTLSTSDSACVGIKNFNKITLECDLLRFCEDCFQRSK